MYRKNPQVFFLSYNKLQGNLAKIFSRAKSESNLLTFECYRRTVKSSNAELHCVSPLTDSIWISSDCVYYKQESDPALLD